MDITLIIFNESYSKKEEIKIKKPKSFQELKEQLHEKFNIYLENKYFFILDNRNGEKKISNEDNYKEVEDILFIQEINEGKLEQSSNDISNSKNINESQLDESNICSICTYEIREINLLKCNNCNKLFHEECIKNWDKECESNDQPLTCPLCRDESPIELWKKITINTSAFFKNYIKNLMGAIKEITKNNNMKSEIITNHEKKINGLIDINNKQNELIKSYEEYINKTIDIFKYLLKKIKNIHNSLKFKENIKLKSLIENFPLNIKNLCLDDISNTIEAELYTIDSHLYEVSKRNNNKKNNNINFEEEEEIMPNYAIPNNIKDEINIKYFVKEKGNYNIFGEKFVKNNIDNIDLIINDEPNKLVNKYQLDKGENTIKIILNDDLKDLSYMFSSCKSLKSINGLKYLDVSNIIDFSYMFKECSLLSNINALEKWNVSRCKNFSNMFRECSKLSNIKALEKWDVSGGGDFQGIFLGCSSLTDIKSLENWNTSKGINFREMFYRCESLSDINPIKNWNVSNGINFQSMFTRCTNLTDLRPLQNWDVSKGEDFQKMFWNCSSLSNVEPLKNWDVSNGKDFQNMFFGCSSSLDVSVLKQNWKVSIVKLTNIK